MSGMISDRTPIASNAVRHSATPFRTRSCANSSRRSMAPPLAKSVAIRQTVLEGATRRRAACLTRQLHDERIHADVQRSTRLAGRLLPSGLDLFLQIRMMAGCFRTRSTSTR